MGDYYIVVRRENRQYYVKQHGSMDGDPEFSDGPEKDLGQGIPIDAAATRILRLTDTYFSHNVRLVFEKDRNIPMEHITILREIVEYRNKYAVKILDLENRLRTIHEASTIQNI